MHFINSQIMSLAFSLSQAVVFEKPGLEGSCLEIDSDVFSICESQGDIATDGENMDSTQLKSMGSLKIIGGLWVFILHSLGSSRSSNLDLKGSLFLCCCCQLVNLRLCHNSCSSLLPAGWATASLGLRASSSSWRRGSTWTAATGGTQSSSCHWDQYWV